MRLILVGVWIGVLFRTDVIKAATANYSVSSVSNIDPSQKAEEEHTAHLKKYLRNEESVASQKADDDYVVSDGPCTHIDLKMDGVGPSWIEVRWAFRCDKTPSGSQLDFELTFGADLHAFDSHSILPSGHMKLTNLYERVEYRVCVIAHYKKNDIPQKQASGPLETKLRRSRRFATTHLADESDTVDESETKRNYERRCDYVTTSSAKPINSILLSFLILGLLVLLTVVCVSQCCCRVDERDNLHSGCQFCSCCHRDDGKPSYSPLPVA